MHPSWKTLVPVVISPMSEWAPPPAPQMQWCHAPFMEALVPTLDKGAKGQSKPWRERFFFLRVYCFSRGRPLSHNQGLQTLCCVVEFVGMRFMPQEEHAAGRMTMTRLKELRKAAGFACTREGLLCDRELRPWVDFAAIVTKDWVHTFLQDGIMQNEVLLFVHSAQHLGVTLQRLRSFLREPWRFPSRCGCTGKNMHKVFDDKRSNMERIRTTCSEMLALYGMLRCFVETQVPQDAATVNARRSFFAACDVVDAILVVKNQNEGYRAVADALQSLAEKHMAAHVAAYGAEFLKPKSHWSFEICCVLWRSTRTHQNYARWYTL